MVTITASKKNFTYADLMSIPQVEGERYEILRGVLVVSASPAERHAWITGQLFMLINAHVQIHRLGAVYHGPVDVRLTEFDVVVPDLMFLSTERRHLYTGRQAVDGAPDMVVEVLSPSTRSRDLTSKMTLYAEAGVSEYWIVDPDTVGLTIYRRTALGDFEALREEGGVLTSQVIAGLKVTVADVFPTEDES
jgi:Uma2 family endonuclease